MIKILKASAGSVEHMKVARVTNLNRTLEELKKQLGIDAGDTTPDGKFSLRSLRCVGACGLAPVVMIGEKVYGRVTPDMVAGILAECK